MNSETWLCGGPPRNGQRQRYPGRFLFNVRRSYPSMLADDALSVFSGAAGGSVCVDSRLAARPSCVADYAALPFQANTFGAVIADPPYADHYQGEWGGALPVPKHILMEAARVVRAGGLVGILHIIVIPAYRVAGVERIALHPVLAGPNNAVRVFNVFRKLEACN